MLAQEAEERGNATGETVEGSVALPKPLYLHAPLDEQGDALGDASRALFDMAKSLDRKGLSDNADSLRRLAAKMRADSKTELHDLRVGRSGKGWGRSNQGANRTPEDLLEDWEMLPEELNRPASPPTFGPGGRLRKNVGGVPVIRNFGVPVIR
ncbi:MAG TPA: hypothetical protein VGX76_15875 [Pirellulales bacterium]|nr:hypothetical protein [Pirellulales bacterium]